MKSSFVLRQAQQAESVLYPFHMNIYEAASNLSGSVHPELVDGER
jgi:hypothetical protein